MEIFDFSHFVTIKGLDPAAIFARFGRLIINLGSFRKFFNFLVNLQLKI